MELPGASFQTRKAGERLIALAGNPNVGKSTVFNGLTGLHQHTGNWAGKLLLSEAMPTILPGLGTGLIRRHRC